MRVSNGAQAHGLRGLTRPTVLIIAASDSSGGAGIVRDLQVLTNFKVQARCVVTAVTAQTDSRVAAVHRVPPRSVREQMQTALEAGPVDAIKIGMLGWRATVEAVAECLPSRDRIPIVLDPVLASSSGAALMDPPGLVALRDLLLPKVTLVTPNLLESTRLLREGATPGAMTVVEQARRLQRLGAQAVLIKGGHGSDDESVDVLITESDPPRHLRARRLDAAARGTGCALSTAIAASLARRVPMATACERAKAYVLRHVLMAARQPVGR